MADFLPKSIADAAVAGTVAGVTGFGLYLAYNAVTGSSAAGFAAAAEEDEEEVSTTSVSKGGHSLYETDKAVSEYLMFHFHDQNKDFCPYDCAPTGLNFAKRTADICADELRKTPAFAGAKLRALDVGCAVGRSSFEMARACDEVVGVDFSQKFVDAAVALATTPSGKSYSYTVEGVLKASATARVPSDIDASRCRFIQGDACSLDAAALGKFHVVHAANLLCRLPNPRAFLASLPDIVVDGGLAIFISPYSWLKQYTPDQGKWLGGHSDAEGKPIDSFTVLRDIMASHGFTLEREGQEPFVIREHRRKFQWGCSHLTVWRKTA